MIRHFHPIKYLGLKCIIRFHKKYQFLILKLKFLLTLANFFLHICTTSSFPALLVYDVEFFRDVVCVVGYVHIHVHIARVFRFHFPSLFS